MPTCLALSPHLDDVAFSAGGVLRSLGVEHGWRTVLATVFTASVPQPTGFALACQLDKGLGPEVDYLELRRAEDGIFAARAEVATVHWLGHPEAPHRGYGSAPELFAGTREGDDIWRVLGDEVAGLVDREQPDLVLAPQGLGGHVDHLQLIRAVIGSVGAGPGSGAAGAGVPVGAGSVGAGVPVAWYRDTPYAMRAPDARPGGLVPGGLSEVAVPIDADAKAHAAAAYTSQLGFQFGGVDAMAAALRHFAHDEGRRLGSGGAVEALLAAPAAEALLQP